MLASVIIFLGGLNSLIIIKLLTVCNQLPSIRHTRTQGQSLNLSIAFAQPNTVINLLRLF